MIRSTAFTNGAKKLIRGFSTSSKAFAEIEVSQPSPKVFHVKLNRPERRNTFTFELWQQMSKTFKELNDDPTCRAIVLSGNGKSFCAGIDLQQGMGKLIAAVQGDMDIGRKGRVIEKVITEAQAGYTALEKCQKPVIAAIHSHCIGAGIDMITACDIRYASKCSVFSIREVDIGMAADVGTLNRIQKIVGNDSWTREIAYTARDFGVDEAHNYGLVSRVFDDAESTVEGALELARMIASKSPIGVGGTKIVLNHARNHSIDESLEFVKIWNMSQLQSKDLIESAMAAMNKKKATYEDL